MSRKGVWIFVLIALDVVWAVYLYFTTRLAIGIIGNADRLEILSQARPIAVLVPFVLLTTVASWVLAFPDMSKHHVSNRVGWIAGFLLLPAIIAPVYFAVVFNIRPEGEAESVALRPPPN